jgi:hypothetical protein
MKWLRVGGLVALVLSVVIVMYLALRQVGGTKPGSAAASASAESDLGAPAPEAVRSSPKAAKQHVERQSCLANCAAETRTCQATADGVEAEQRCRDQGRACESECP